MTTSVATPRSPSRNSPMAGPFTISGPYYFISGVRDNCLKNQKMVVIVLADRSKNGTAPPPETAAAPPPSETTTSPPPSPSAEAPRSPAPAGEAPPSPPPNGGVEMNPTPAPSEESKPDHKNGSSLAVTNCFVLPAAFAGSSVFRVL